METEKLYSIKDVREELKISRQTFYNMKRDGLIPQPIAYQQFKYSFFTKQQLEEIRSKIRPRGHQSSI